MRTRHTTALPTRLLGALVGLLLLAGLGPSSAQAKLSGAEWKEAEARFKELFAQRGFPEEKKSLLATIASDDSGRAWRTLAEALFLEVEIWSGVQTELTEATNEQITILQQHKGGYTAVQENRLKELTELLKQLDVVATAERKALDNVVEAVTAGPDVLRSNIMKRARGGGEWPFRAAAVRVAAATMKEKDSAGFLQNAIEADKDPRVRLAGLDAIAGAEEGWEPLVIGRLGDPNWNVVLQAAKIAQARELHSAVPHLINALGSASPRMAEALGTVLCALTKENFEPYVDVWSKWWQDHQKDFEKTVKLKGGKQAEFGEVHFYGVQIKSDRVMFIIDISGSMKLPTKNDNPMERWKPPPVTTGKSNPPPPPPPPEEILSGPKIDVAKHELKKAITKLPKEWTFNIISFNHGASHWQPTMMVASDKNKESAYEWIRALNASGSTYIDGALRMGFQIAGLINYDKRYPDIQLDTIVLLSDGAPTDNTMPVSKLMDPEEILGHVREWNKDKAVIIHCIGVDLVEDIDFLKRLAAENGGTYVDR